MRIMKPWKSLAIASAVTAFAATAQAECLGVSHATQTVTNETATGTVTTNRRALNRLASNRLASNRLASNQPGEGAASDIIAIEMPDGTRLSR
jgi:hypothetical protein